MGENIFYASDYFERFYEIAENLIQFMFVISMKKKFENIVELSVNRIDLLKIEIEVWKRIWISFCEINLENYYPSKIHTAMFDSIIQKTKKQKNKKQRQKRKKHCDVIITYIIKAHQP